MRAAILKGAMSAKLATAVPDLLPQLQMVHCLGQIFDGTVLQDRWLRPLANHWVKWAARQILRFAHVRADVLSTIHPPSAASAADGDAASLSDASDSPSGSDDGWRRDGSSDAESDTESESDSDSLDAD